MEKQNSKPERGPSAAKGHQFSGSSSAELLQELAKASNTLRLINGAQRPSRSPTPEVQLLQSLHPAELDELRDSTRALLTDLRAELRRREHI